MGKILKEINQENFSSTLANYVGDTVKAIGKSERMIQAINNMSKLTSELTEIFVNEKKTTIFAENVVNTFISMLEISYIFGINLNHHLEQKVKYTYGYLRKMLSNEKE